MAEEQARRQPAWQRKLLEGAGEILSMHLSGMIGGQNVDIREAARAKADADQAQAQTGVRIPRPGERDFQNALPNLTAAQRLRAVLAEFGLQDLEATRYPGLKLGSDSN